MTITELLLQVDTTALPEYWTSMLIVAGKFLLNIAAVFMIVRFGYSNGKQKAEFVFTYFTFNVLIFFLCFLMTQVDLSLGFAFGLFALFSIMRYRTTTIEIREMTYLFVVVSLGVLNSVTGQGVPFAEIFLINLAILLTVCISERQFLGNHTASTSIRYEKIALLNADKIDDLKADLEKRMGVKIINIEVLMLNYMTDSADLQVYYQPGATTLQKSQKTVTPYSLKKDLPEEIHT